MQLSILKNEIEYTTDFSPEDSREIDELLTIYVDAINSQDYGTSRQLWNDSAIHWPPFHAALRVISYWLTDNRNIPIYPIY